MPGLGKLTAEAQLWRRRRVGNDIRLFAGIELDEKSVLESPVRIAPNTMVYGSSIGCYSYVGAHSVIQGATIGKFCSGAWGITVGASAHPLDRATTHTFPWRSQDGEFVKNEDLTAEPVRVGHDVWIGCDCVILSGVTIGNSAVIAAGAVVTHDVPAYAVVMGAPARVVRFRYDDAVRKRMSSLSWWDWPRDVLRQHVELFKAPLTDAVIAALEDLARSHAAETPEPIERA